MRLALLLTLAFFSLFLSTHAFTPQQEYDAKLAASLGADDYGMRQYVLVILKTGDIEAALARVTAAGGQITRPIFAFPGGRRF